MINCKNESIDIGYMYADIIYKKSLINSRELYNILNCQRKLGNKSLIYDLSGDLYRRFSKKENHIMSIFDTKAENWDFWCEDIPTEFIAKSLLKSKKLENKFFHKHVCEIISDILNKSKNIDDLKILMKFPNENLTKIIDENYKSEFGGKLLKDSIIACIIVNLNFIKEMNDKIKKIEKFNKNNKDKFSLSKWVKEDKDNSWVFIIDRISEDESIRNMHNLWIDIVKEKSYKREEYNRNLKVINMFLE